MDESLEPNRNRLLETSKVNKMANFANVGGANDKVMGQADMARLVVRGRGAHIATALTTMGWSKTLP